MYFIVALSSWVAAGWRMYKKLYKLIELYRLLDRDMKTHAFSFHQLIDGPM